MWSYCQKDKYPYVFFGFFVVVVVVFLGVTAAAAASPSEQSEIVGFIDQLHSLINCYCA